MVVAGLRLLFTVVGNGGSAFLDNHIDECVYGVDSFGGFDKKPLSFVRCRKPFLVQSLVFASENFGSL